MTSYSRRDWADRWLILQDVMAGSGVGDFHYYINVPRVSLPWPSAVGDDFQNPAYGVGLFIMAGLELGELMKAQERLQE